MVLIKADLYIIETPWCINKHDIWSCVLKQSILINSGTFFRLEIG